MVQQCVSPKFNRFAIEPLLTRICRSNFNVTASTFRRNTTEPLMRFVPLQHHQHASPFRGGRTRRTSPHETPEPIASLPRSQPFRLQGFYPRDGFLLTWLCRFVSSGGHSWGFSLQSLSLRRSRFAFRRPLPSCRFSLSRCRYVLRAFRAFICVEIRWRRFCVSTESAASMLSWVSHPSGFSPVSPWYRLRGPSSPFSGPPHGEVNLNGVD